MAYGLSSWCLDQIRPKDLNKTLSELESRVSHLEKKRPQLASSISPSEFFKWIEEFSQLKKEASKIACYAGLSFAEDSSNQEAQARKSKVENVLTGFHNRLLFFDLWFKSLPEKKAQELIEKSGKYHYYLSSLRRMKPFTLKENEEKIINLKDLSGSSALNSIYELMTSQFEFKFQGKKVTLNELTAAVRDKNPETRKEAYLTLLSQYQKHKDIFGEIYKNIVNDWREEYLGLRGYKTPLGVRNLANDLPDQAVKVLLDACGKNQALFHRFFEIKRKKLGLKKLRRFDLYAPVKSKDSSYSYDQAVNLVLSTFQEFSPEFAENAEKIISRRHVHSQLQKNKNTGAFCCSVNTEILPFVLLNYTGKIRDVSTLAHELGHGIHQVLACCQTEFTHEACLPLAETASIFSEMLLSERLLKENPEKAEGLIFTKIDDLYASIIRQAGFVRFEILAHQMMKEGRTIEEMSQVYLQELKKQLGPKVEVDDVFAYEWCYIPHIFHTPFYCYAYAFGNLLTLALYQTYKEKGPAFVSTIIKMLSQGGGESPLKITKAVGVDICSEQFWQKGFDSIKEMIEKIEK